MLLPICKEKGTPALGMQFLAAVKGFEPTNGVRVLCYHYTNPLNKRHYANASVIILYFAALSRVLIGVLR